MPKKRQHRLTALQQRFVEEYLIDLNATQAAIRVGINPNHARQQAHRWMTNDYIQGAIAEQQDARSRRTHITQDNVLRRLAQAAFTDLDTFITWKGNKLHLRPMDEIPQERFGALQEIAETREGLRVKLADRMPALTLLARHLRLLPIPGLREDPLQLEHTMKEGDVDLSKLSDEQLRNLREALGAIIAAGEIASGRSRSDS